MIKCLRVPDRFKILGRLGEGGMGVVYIAYDGERQERVALKTVRKLSPPRLLRFKREFRELAEIVHPNLVVLYELFGHDESWFYTMELVEGLDLLSYLGLGRVDGDMSPSLIAAVAPADWDATTRDLPDAAASPQRLSFEVADAARLSETLPQLVAAIEAVHRAGKLHSDIKPSNVRVTADGRIVLLDFGLVHDADDVRSRELPYGTPLYLAPEVLSGEAPSRATDWYAVGVMLCQALTGRQPFVGDLQSIYEAKQGRDWAAVLESSGSPATLSNLCARLLSPEPALRPDGTAILEYLGATEQQTSTEAAVSLSVKPTPFVGRRRELGELRQALERCRSQDAPTVVLVHGPSGLGKTTLVQQFLSASSVPGSDDSPPVVLQGRCFVRETVPYKAFDRVVDDLARFLDGQGDDEAASLLPEGVGSIARLFPVLEGICGQRMSAPCGNSVALRTRALNGLKRVLHRIAERYSLVVFLDDIQWTDRDSALLADALLSPPGVPPLLLIASYRSEEARSSPMLPALRRVDRPRDDRYEVREIGLRELTVDNVRELVTGRLSGSTEDSSAIADRIASEAGGHPLFATELTRDAERCGRAGPPPTLDTLLGERIRELPQAARRFLEVVAVAGYPIAQRRAGDAAGGLGGTDLTVLQSQHFLRFAGPLPGDPAVVYHDRIRENVIAMLDDSERREVHRRLAEAVRASDAPDPEVLVMHLEGAGLTQESRRHAAAAAEKAAKALAFDRAAELYRLALSQTSLSRREQSELQKAMGDALVGSRRIVEAAESYLEAGDLAEEPERTALRRHAAKLLFHSHNEPRSARVEALIVEACAGFGLRLPRTFLGLVLATIRLSLRLRRRGLDFVAREERRVGPELLERIDAAWEMATGLTTGDIAKDALMGSVTSTFGLLLAIDAGEPYRLGRALLLESIFASTEPDRYIRRGRRLRAMAEALIGEYDDPYIQAYRLLADGWIDTLAGRVRAGYDTSDRAQRQFLARCPQATWEVMVCRYAMSACAFSLGNVTEIEATFPDVLAEARERGFRFEQGLCVKPLSLLHLARDDVSQARQLVAELEATLGGPVRDFRSAVWRMIETARSLVALYSTDPAAARRLLSVHRSLCKKLRMVGFQQMRVEAWLQLGSLALLAARDGGRDTKRLVLRAIARLDADAAPTSRPMAAMMRSALAYRSGSTSRARRWLERSATGFEEADMLLHANATRRHLGRLQGGDLGRALVDASDAALAELGVADPERLSRALAPGFEGPI